MKIKELSKDLSKPLGPVPCNNGAEDKVKERQKSEISTYAEQEKVKKEVFDDWSEDKKEDD